MAHCLIGHTGFVGGQLTRSHPFDCLYNSKNINEITGRSFHLLVCAGAPAEKWKANRDPDSDLQNLDRLWNALRRARAEKVILISTVDVYARPIHVCEDDDVGVSSASAYGRHRFELERRVTDHFEALVVRLPGLFGPGLKKNAIFDLLNGNEIHKIDQRASYQFYDITRLWDDIKIAQDHDLRLLNLATEPTTMLEVAQEAFGIDLVQQPSPLPARYDFRSKHASLFGGSNGYLISKVDVLKAIRKFVDNQRSIQSQCA